MIIAPCDQANLVKGRVENGATTYPLLHQLLCKGRFLYVINKETTTEIVKQLREETRIFKDQFQEQSQQVEQLRGDQLRGDLEQLHGDLEQLHGDLDEFKEETLNRFDETSTQLDKIQTMLELIVSKLHNAQYSYDCFCRV